MSDEHLIDVWHRTDRPAYQKYLCWEGHNKEIKFIVQMESFSHRWSTCIQLPYVRKQILTENMAVLTRVAEKLLEKETIDGQEFEECFNI